MKAPRLRSKIIAAFSLPVVLLGLAMVFVANRFLSRSCSRTSLATRSSSEPSIRRGSRSRPPISQGTLQTHRSWELKPTGASRCRTTALVWTHSTPNGFSSSSSVCTPGRNTPVRESVSLSARELWSATADVSGSSPSPREAPRSISRFRTSKERAHELFRYGQPYPGPSGRG